MTWWAIAALFACAIAFASAMDRVAGLLREILAEQRQTNEHLRQQRMQIDRLEDVAFEKQGKSYLR